MFAEFFYQLMDDVVIEMLALIFCMASSIAMAQIMITDVMIIIILPRESDYCKVFVHRLCGQLFLLRTSTEFNILLTIC